MTKPNLTEAAGDASLREAAPIGVDVTVLQGDRTHVRAWPPKPGKDLRETDVAESFDLAVALWAPWEYDAHCAQYAAGNRRLSKAALEPSNLAQLPTGRVQMTTIIFDVDGPGHRATSEWRAGEAQKVARLMTARPGTVAYDTSAGYRLVAMLSEPIDLEELDDASNWAALYLGAVDLLRRDFQIEADESCKDWTRLFRLPNVVREGKQVSSALLGDLSAGTWDRDALIDGERVAPVCALPRAPAKQPGGRLANIRPVTRCPPGVASEAHAVAICKAAPAAIRGRRGHNALLTLATDLVVGLELAPDYAAEIAGEHFNPRCEPPWDLGSDGDGADFKRKFTEAAVNRLGRAPGYLLAPGGDASPDELRTDLGNSRRLVRLHGTGLRYFAALRAWFVWDGRRWCKDERGLIEQYAKSAAETLLDDAKLEADDERRKAAFKWAVDCQNHGRIKYMIVSAQSEPGIPIVADELDADPWLLSVQNGTLDLRSGALRDPDRALLITKVAAAPYLAGARSALWDSFVKRLTGGDAAFAAYLQRAIGYALFGAWREKMFWFGYGPPDGGKSTFLGVLGDVLGDYAVSADASTWMLQHNVGGNRGDVTRLRGARLVTTSEVRPSARFDPQLMKGVTGGDTLTASAKYAAEISFRPTFALWFGANERPIIPDDDDGFWNRVRCVPFVNVIPKEEQDNELREKLAGPEHAPAVLAWAVEGFAMWQREGIGTCSAVEAATTAYRRDMNQAAGFFDEYCTLDATGEVSAARLRAAYEAWCKANGVYRPLQGKAWRKRLLALGATGGDDASKVRSQRMWFGITLKAEG